MKAWHGVTAIVMAKNKHENKHNDENGNGVMAAGIKRMTNNESGKSVYILSLPPSLSPLSSILSLSSLLFLLLYLYVAI